MRRGAVWALVLVLLAGAVGCGDGGTGPADDAVPESQLTFLRFPAALQPLVSRSGSFYAVKGDDRELVLRYQPESPDEEGEEFLEFRVPGDALLRRPDGRSFQAGDSILISVQVSGDGRFLFDFQPSGLRFDPDHAPRLRISYRALDDDLDDDGDLDDADDAFERSMRLWRQERSGQPWYPVGSMKLEDVDEIDGEITGFTGFAIAG